MRAGWRWENHSCSSCSPVASQGSDGAPFLISQMPSRNSLLTASPRTLTTVSEFSGQCRPLLIVRFILVVLIFFSLSLPHWGNTPVIYQHSEIKARCCTYLAFTGWFPLATLSQLLNPDPVRGFANRFLLLILPNFRGLPRE